MARRFALLAAAALLALTVSAPVGLAKRDGGHKPKHPPVTHLVVKAVPDPR